MWKVCAALALLNLSVFMWLCSELGLFSSTQVFAGDTTPTSNEVRKVSDLKEKELKRKEEALARRERDLADKEKLLTTQVARYEKIIAELNGKIGELENFRSDKAESFKGVFEKMDAKKASKIIEDLDPKIAGGIIAGMKRDRAGEILSAMSADKAKMITEFVLGKRGTSSVQRKSGSGTQVSTSGDGGLEKGGEP